MKEIYSSQVPYGRSYFLGTKFMWPPIDSEIGGGWGQFKIDIPEFESLFAWHDEMYNWIILGIATKTLKQYDKAFYWAMCRAALAAPETWRKVKLLRYAWLCYRIARIWAETVRRPLENWKPGQPPIKL